MRDWSDVVKRKKEGSLLVGINMNHALFIGDSKNLYPTRDTTKQSFKTFKYISIISYIGSIILSFMYQWWIFIPGFFIGYMVWESNKKSLVQNLISAIDIDQEFFLKIEEKGWWIYRDI